MKQEPLLSVIVPVYNVEEFLPRCVDSLLAQTYQNLEILLVDDGATDLSGRICDQYAAKDSRVRVIHKENGGLSSARNAGLDAHRGEYIAFLDSDDWMEPDAFETMLGLAEKYAAKLVCAGRYDVYADVRVVSLCPEREEKCSGEEVAGRIFRWDHCDSSACDKLYHSSLWQHHRFPVGKVCEDVPVIYRVVLEAGEAVMCDRPFLNYYHRPGSITLSTVSEKSFHFSEHTAEIYPYIRDNYPNLADAARYQRVKSLAQILLLLDTDTPEVRRQFARRYGVLRRQLAAHFGFLCRCPWLTKKEKVQDILLILGLYRFLRPIFHKENP